MHIRKTAQVSAFAGTVAIGLRVSAVSSQSQALLDSESKYAPIQSISYDFGSKSTSG